jgi:hypothetical protein
MLVVEGQITDQRGPFQVKLTNTVPLSNDSNSIPVLFADVRIVDNQGKEFRLYGDISGLYQTSEKDLKGTPGNTYTLFVKTSDNEEYFSSPVEMQDVPNIDSLYFEEVQHIHFDAGQPVGDNWLNILLNSHDSAGKTKYWRFDFVETWQVDLTADPIRIQHDPLNPLDVSYNWIKDSLPKKICWVTKPSHDIIVLSTGNSPSDEIKRFTVSSLGPGQERLRIRYSILVRQYSISHELYDYLKLLKALSENAGGIYGTVPVPVFGNIISSNENKKALGYFAASSVKDKRLFILMSEHHVKAVSANSGCTYYDFPFANGSSIFFGTSVNFKAIYSLPGPCEDCDTYGTKVKPSFW